MSQYVCKASCSNKLPLVGLIKLSEFEYVREDKIVVMIVALFLGFVFIFLFCLFDDYFSWQYYLYQHSMTLKMTDPVSLNSSSFLKQSTGPHQGACLSTAWTDLGSIPLSTLDEPLELCKTLGMWVHWLRVSGSFSS